MQDIKLLKKHVLCYVRYDLAIFTNCPLEHQPGDDWDDAPYEHNASLPFHWDEREKLPHYTLIYVRFSVDMQTPEEIAGLNSAYSVDDINNRKTPWLTPTGNKNTKPIYAGVTIEEFQSLIWANGGDILVPLQRPHTYFKTVRNIISRMLNGNEHQQSG